MGAAGVDEIDLALLDAVHVNPRVKYDELSRVLGISGVTAARRWRHLVDTGRAWVSSSIGPALPVVGSMIEVECEPGTADAVAARFAALPQVFSVHLTTGRFNLYALIVAADQPMTSTLLIDVLPSISGVRALRTAAVVRLFSGTFWRLGAISSVQARQVAEATTRTNPRRGSTFDTVDRELYLALQQDGRMSYRDLGSRLGCSELVARRRLLRLTRSGLLTFRTDFARADAGWPTSVVLALRMPGGSSLPEAGKVLVSWPETRVCAAIIGGPAQLFVTMQIHELGAIDALIAALQRSFPGVEILSAQTVLRAVKSFGRLLDVDGHACGVVPVDPWSPSTFDWKQQFNPSK
ncbi:Lrp/AsnC family transcriptional regulator [Rhodococcus sp. NPDC057135]|uniref:Lrp/AsnC family transcriptional regulator n=1 Tax=Rhodococcus sp. NPDC057135 TaxID=3346028 RepID=UPI00364389E3